MFCWQLACIHMSIFWHSQRFYICCNYTTNCPLSMSNSIEHAGRIQVAHEESYAYLVNYLMAPYMKTPIKYNAATGHDSMYCGANKEYHCFPCSQCYFIKRLEITSSMFRKHKILVKYLYTKPQKNPERSMR